MPAGGAAATRKLLLLAIAAATLLDVCRADEKVSFYGASYIHLSVQEAKSTTDISFRFRTHLSDAMLLLAAGKIDYCSVKLESGRLKVHINLGAGEKELSSARELKLNDLSWHEVTITRRDANITLTVDAIHSVRDVLPGRFFELNINFGVYIGGQGDFKELFLGHTEYLRGCMADIAYNGIRVIEQARGRKNSTEATAVSYGCSAIFDAGGRAEISFVEDGAFTAIARSVPRSGSRWQLQMKTAFSSGLLLFNAGQSSHADFLGVELQDGRVRILMNKGNGPTELMHSRVVSDGRWHEVQLDFTPNLVAISVDGVARNLSLPAGNRYLDLADTLYVGGAELSKRAKALSKGLKSGDVSYKGCLRNMLLDGKELGLPHVKVSHGLVLDCVWGFPCAEAEPCVPDATCSQLGVRSFKCTCDRTLCIKPNFTEEYKLRANLPISLELLSVRPVAVYEGKRAVVSERNIAMLLDIAKYGVNESLVAFLVLAPPVRGSLHLDKAPLASKTPFTLYDVQQHKLTYQHDGSETTSDNMVLKVAFHPTTRLSLPGYFQDSLRFNLHVNVTPVNDPPRLEIPASLVLRLAQGTRKTLTSDLIRMHDPDSGQDSLIYTVLQNDSDIGHIERVSSYGVRVHNFTQAELAQGHIDYVHSGKNKSKATLGLVVSDGNAVSPPQYLHISTFPLTIKLKHNTGLVVVHRSFSYLTPANLSFATNADDAKVDIRFTVITAPVFGIIQCQREPNSPWINSNSFTSRDLEMQTVRYLHNVGSPRHDSFKFQANVNEVHSPSIYDFNVTFIILELLEIRRDGVSFSHGSEVTIVSRHLKYQTNPLLTDASMIVYSLLEAPKYGHVYLDYDRRLHVGQTFTQQDVDSSRLRYRHYKHAYSTIEDSIVFKISAQQCSDVINSLSLSYVPSMNTNLPQSVEQVKVIEGHRAPVKIQTNFGDFGVGAMTFNLTRKPEHGWLTIYYDALPITPNTTSFTTEDLTSHSVFYVHDDSETLNDVIEFLAISSDDTDFMYVGRFDVKIDLRNDNPPRRMNQRIFQVVAKSDKVVTRSDLLYTDEDLNTTPNKLVYKVNQISSGEIYKLNEPVYQINQFTQQDIDDEKIVYKHRGSKSERIDFTVSDGELFTNGELMIHAGQPYAKLLLHDGTVVQSNRSVVLSVKDIDLETNVNVNAAGISFTAERPKYGVLLKNGKETLKFDRNDLVIKTVEYKHLAASVKDDHVKLRVNVADAQDTGILLVKVLPETYWEPLLVQNNSTMYVEEATSVILTRKSLEIGHPEIPASRITYHVKDWPKNGYLEVQTHEDAMDDDGDYYGSRQVKHFKQSLVNDARVYYVQSKPNKTHDRFVVDVTNGITWLRNLTVNILIIPDKLYAAARNLSVLEGKSVIFHESDFYAETAYYSGKLMEYRVREKPKHGTIIDRKNIPTKQFTQKQLTAKEISYKNNGDEVGTDHFKLIAVAGDKGSEPFDVWVNVVPINDEIPALVNNTGFSIWQGGSMPVTNEMLAAVDNDTMPTEITYTIRDLTSGYFSLSESPGVEIHNFSQEMINTMKILFTHTNGSEARFNFTITDGQHSSPVHQMVVTTKPVRIIIQQNKALSVFPLSRKPLSSELLLTSCTDKDRNAKYFVRSGPSMGKIIMETSEGSWIEVDRFTQKDVNDSRVSYEHNKQFNNLSASDSFTFDVETYFAAPIKDQVFKIDISVSSGGLHRFVSITPIRIKEGGDSSFSMNISGINNFLRTKAAIANPDVSLRLIQQPKHGHVMLTSNLNLTIFSQKEAEDGKIAYYHDHSDSIRDQIDFTVYFSPGHVVLCNVSVPVEIEPVNDEPFKIEIVEKINVVQNQTQTITKQNLLTTDPDTGPEGIIYEIINSPAYGELLLLSADHSVNPKVRKINQDVSKLVFTQQDIDSSRLIYEHRGPLLPTNIYFRVSDGRFNHEYRVVDINIHPIQLNVTVLKPVDIQQGSTSAIIDNTHLKLDTNVRQDLVTYEVVQPPKHGVIHAREQTFRFKHTDLLSKNVVYVQNNLSVSNDSLELSARVSHYEVRNIRIPIKVVPLMITSPHLEVFAGDRTKLSITYFDATPLAKLSGTDPLYKVIRKPKYAKIMRILNRTMSSGENRGLFEMRVNDFSHSEVLSGLIYLVCRNVPTNDIYGVPDSFEFVISAPYSAPRFQPALGTFEFRVKLVSDYYNNSLGGPMDPVGHEGELPIAPNMSDDYSVILGMLMGVFLLGICVIVTIRCKQSQYKDEDDEDEEEDQDKVEPASPSIVSLPRPPDHLLPATPHLKRYTNEHHNNTLSHSSTPLPPMMPSLTSTLPQCKVIPLTPMENMTGSEIDVSARYPYGVPDTDDWSSFDTTELPCPSQTSQQQRATANPLLRRNQYWV